MLTYTGCWLATLDNTSVADVNKPSTEHCGQHSESKSAMQQFRTCARTKTLLSRT